MRKTTILFLFMVAFIGLNAQNLLKNGGFEEWNTTNNLPDPWYIVSKTVTGVTLEHNNATVNEGKYSFKVDATSASGTYNVAQGVDIVPGGDYTLTAYYNVSTGDGTDVRLWCNYKKDAATFFSDAELTATGDYATLRSGNTSSNGSSYLPSGTGWQQATFTFKAPTTPVAANGFDFQFRTYKGAIVFWDNMSLVGPVPTGVDNAKAQSLNLWMSNGKVNFNAERNENIEVYNLMGQKLLQAIATEGQNEISIPAKGVAIVKVGNRTGKVIL